MRKLLHMATIASVLLFFVFFIAYKLTGNIVLYSLYITFMTFSYHFIMRLIVGCFKSKKDCNAKWFKPKRFEKNLYNFLKVKSWKKHIHAYDPESFDTRYTSLEQIVKNMCNAEIVHERICILSFLPILFSIKYGAPLVYIITSVLACMVDLVFVIVQRYNRPRLVKLINKKSKNYAIGSRHK